VQPLAQLIKLIFCILDEKGVTAIEYGLIAALIATVVITALSLIGTNLSTTFNTIANTL
jgi:pilus assembly protein Flp/PilA